MCEYTFSQGDGVRAKVDVLFVLACHSTVESRGVKLAEGCSGQAFEADPPSRGWMER